MATESASFDALRQRFGRVDRLGEYKDEEGNGKAEGVIVHNKDEKDDPVYQKTIVETIKWLKGRIDRKTKTVDFGSRSLLDAPAGLLAPKEDAPRSCLPISISGLRPPPNPTVSPNPGCFCMDHGAALKTCKSSGGLILMKLRSTHKHSQTSSRLSEQSAHPPWKRCRCHSSLPVGGSRI